MPLLEAGMADLRRFGIGEYMGFARSLVAEAEAFAGDPSRGLEIAEEELVSADRQLPMLHRIAGIALHRLGRSDAAERQLASALETARATEAEYDIAATVDILASLGLAQPSDLREHDAILARLKIERLPKPDLDETASYPRAHGSPLNSAGMETVSTMSNPIPFDRSS
jgi:hypothetical protein